MIGYFAVFGLGCILPVAIANAIVFFQKRSLAKQITPSIANPAKLCKGPHSWMTAKFLMMDGLVSKQACRVCGLVSGTDTVISQEAIDKIEESNKFIEIEERLYKQFLDTEDKQIQSYMEQELKSGVSFDKLIAIHAIGMTFSQRYEAYLGSKQEEIDKELSKSDA